MLRNRRGATSLRWLRALLDAGTVVHGQVVVCPGINDGEVLADTLAGILDRYPELASVACVPLGVSRFNAESAMRQHTRAEASTVVDLIEDWQPTFGRAVGHPLVYASDEFYLIAERDLPSLASYGDAAQVENGVGLARTFEARFLGRPGVAAAEAGGFFQSVDGAPASGYRSPRTPGGVTWLPRSTAPVTVLTAAYAAPMISRLIAGVRDDADVTIVPNGFFGGNIAVAGLMTGADVAEVLSAAPPGRRFLLPDVCLSGGVFLDGVALSDLPRPVEVVTTDGAALRRAIAVPTAA
jgi:NifB/MoaA-like Fe-S oxidoreductase